MSADHTPDQTGLTEAEREQLRDWWDEESDADTAGSMLGRLDSAVERIVAARTAELRDRAEKAEAEVARIPRIEDGWRKTSAEVIAHWNRADKAEATLARVEALLSWGNGRGTGGVDRLIPASDLRAALAGSSSLAERDAEPVPPWKFYGCTEAEWDEFKVWQAAKGADGGGE